MTFCHGQTVLSPETSQEESSWMLQHISATTQQRQQILSHFSERVLQADLVLLSLSPPIPCSTLICLSSSGSSGKSSRQARKVEWRDTACFFSAVSNLSLVRSWPIWNARRMWTKTGMYWRAAGFKSVSMIREHTFIGAVLGLSDIRLTFKLGTGSVITLIAPGTSECSTGQIKNDVCSSR